MKKIGRNDRCPCGSGKKYKRCHMGKKLPRLSEDDYWYITKNEAARKQARKDRGRINDAENRIPAVNITPFESKSYTLRIGHAGEWHKVCKVMYSKDGSVFISFPYYQSSQGLLSLCRHKVGETTVSLIEQGKVTSHRVKFTHHASGIAQFSQTFKIWNTVRKKSSPLPTLNGHFASLKFQGVREFEYDTDAADSPPISQKEQILNMRLSNEDWDAKAYHVSFHYYDAKFLASHFDGNKIGPTIRTQDPQGKINFGWLITAPEGYRSHYMYFILLLIEEIPLLSPREEPGLTFIGGFDTPEQRMEKNGDSEFLALMYPTKDFEALKKSIGSVDIEDHAPLPTAKIHRILES